MFQRVEIYAPKSDFSGHPDKDMVHLNNDSGSKGFFLGLRYSNDTNSY